MEHSINNWLHQVDYMNGAKAATLDAEIYQLDSSIFWSYRKMRQSMDMQYPPSTHWLSGYNQAAVKEGIPVFGVYTNEKTSKID